MLQIHSKDGILPYSLPKHMSQDPKVQLWVNTVRIAVGEMEASSELPDWNKGVVKETVADEKQIAQWIAAKPQPDQEQSVNLL